MAKIVVTLFGGPSVSVGGKRVGLSPYQEYLVAVLFGHGQGGVTRSRIAELLWGPVAEAPARRRLSQHLYSLSNRVTGLPIEARGDLIVPRPESVVCDVEDFQVAVQENRLPEAGEYLAAGFLSAVRDPPTREFEDWMTSRSISIRSSLRDRASAVWSTSQSSGDWPAARGAAEVLLHLDPLDERALRRVLLSRAMVGRVHEAEATYAAFRERVAGSFRDHAWQPTEETERLVERIRAIEDGSQSAPIFENQPEAPMCGRRDQLARLRTILASTPDAEPVTVIVSGEGGMGKTRIVEESLVAARLAGMRLMRGRSSEFEQKIPLNPILEALDTPAVGRALETLENPWRTVMLALLPQFNASRDPLPDLGYIQPDSVPRRLYEAIHRLLIEVVKEGPLCLVVDDFHWADETSLTILDFLRRRWNTGGLVMVLAARPEGVQPSSPTARFLSEAGAGKRVEYIELDELEPEDADELITAIANREIDEPTRTAIRALGGSNPFFLIELTLEYLAGRLRQPVDPRDIQVPLSIMQIFGERLDRLTENARQIAYLLAVLDRPVTVTEMEELIGLSTEQVISGVETLTRHRLALWSQDGAQVRHPMVRESIYRTIASPRRTVLHASYGGILARRIRSASSSRNCPTR